MSLRKRMDRDILDLSLKHTLRNWANRSQPPVDGKSTLLKEAINHRRHTSRQRVSKISGLVSMALSENFIEIYLESFKKSPHYSLQPGNIGLNFTNGMIAR